MPPVPDAPGVFAVMVHLPPGYHQYKFIVDGEWRHDETQPNMPDPLGNVNNWLFVRRAEPHHSGQQMTPQGQTATEHTEPFGQQSMQAEAAQSEQASVAPVSEDVDMTEHSVVAPIALQPDEPLQAAAEMTKKKVLEFLSNHTAYELIPESGKVVLLDTELPVRQAFHALHEQGITSAPLWDTEAASIVGMISASDFIHILRHLRNSVAGGSNPLSEQEMDRHTIQHLREEMALGAGEQLELVYCRPDDSLRTVVATLYEGGHSMAPILSCDPAAEDGAIPNLLHIATISGVLACLLRHFRASLSSLPLLSHPLGSLPLGTWVGAPEEAPPGGDKDAHSGRGGLRHVGALNTVTAATPLTTALSMLLEKGVSSLPVVNEQGMLMDIYSRSDITMLAKGNAYSRLQWEDVTVGQALALANQQAQAAAAAAAAAAARAGSVPGGLPPGGLTADMMAAAGTPLSQPPPSPAPPQGQQHPHLRQRVFMCTKRDSLRTVVERLSIPGVRRLVMVEPETRRVEGVISLSDIAAYLFIP